MDNEYYVYEYISENSEEIITSNNKRIFIKELHFILEKEKVIESQREYET